MTKKQHAARGIPCSWQDCAGPVAWRILDSQRRLVRYWCAAHYGDNKHTLTGAGWTAEPVGETHAKPDQKVSSSGAASGGVRDSNRTGEPSQRPGDTSGRSAGGEPDRRLATYSPPRYRPDSDTAGALPDGTGALQPRQAPEVPQLAWWQGAGELQLSPEQQKILWQEVDAEAVQIRPDGIVYLPWAKVWRVILTAFAPHVPALVWLGNPKPEDGSICLHIVMTVGGQFVGEAVGACPWVKSNPNMNWASCVEGAVSDAVVKISKRLGMFQELWSVPWVNAWRAEHAMRVFRSQSRKLAWRRIDDEPFYDEGHPDKSPESEYRKPRTFDDDAREHFDAMSGKPPVWED
jgi:hypothetical protein